MLKSGFATLTSAKNGHQAPPARARTAKMPAALLVPLLVALAAAAIFGRARKGADGGPGPRGNKHRPRNLMRYYGMGVLINALERDATRKLIVAALKYARQRA
jgi:hypothetical protein